jgi:hypothetical protein
MKKLAALALALVATLANAQAMHGIKLADYDIDPRFRAKIVKEKVKQNVIRSQFDDLGDETDRDNCGSQNIGNVNTGGKRGTAPREVFVFAPNAINMVAARGCQ